MSPYRMRPLIVDGPGLRSPLRVQADGSLMQVGIKAGDRFDAAAPRALFRTEIPRMLNPYRWTTSHHLTVNAF
jgi:hypothetical protein